MFYCIQYVDMFVRFLDEYNGIVVLTDFMQTLTSYILGMNAADYDVLYGNKNHNVIQIMLDWVLSLINYLQCDEIQTVQKTSLKGLKV